MEVEFEPQKARRMAGFRFLYAYRLGVSQSLIFDEFRKKHRGGPPGLMHPLVPDPRLSLNRNNLQEYTRCTIAEKPELAVACGLSGLFCLTWLSRWEVCSAFDLHQLPERRL